MNAFNNPYNVKYKKYKNILKTIFIELFKFIIFINSLIIFLLKIIIKIIKNIKTMIKAIIKKFKFNMSRYFYYPADYS